MFTSDAQVCGLEEVLQQANSALRQKTLECSELEEKIKETQANITRKKEEIAQLEEQLTASECILILIYIVPRNLVSIQGNSGPMVLHYCLALATCIRSKSN